MFRLKTSHRLVGLLLAAAIAAGCSGPVSPEATATPAPGYPAPDAAPVYPAPDAAPGYPAPETPTPSPAQGGAAPTGEPAAAAPSVAAQAIAPLSGAPVTGYRVVATYPHDPAAYTQGLVYIGDDSFYEGTGLYGQSSLREVALATGAPLRDPVALSADYFGEGIAVVGEQIFQLTWRECKGFIYDLSFTRTGEFSYPRTAGGACATEGWGLTYDGQRLIMSNGTATLFFVDPAATASSGALAITGQVEVRDGPSPVFQLNELEMVNGELFANIYTSDWIARIDPATGRVNSYIDLSGLRALLPPAGPEVLNGIAYDAAGDRLFITGKLWPSLFEIDLPVARAYLPLALIMPPQAAAQPAGS